MGMEVHNQMGTGIDANADLTDLNFVPQVKVVEATDMPHEYPVSDLSLIDGSLGNFKIVGRVMNDTDEEEYLYINAILYDSEGNCIGITGTNVADMTPNNNTSFEISGMMWQTLQITISLLRRRIINGRNLSKRQI